MEPRRIPTRGPDPMSDTVRAERRLAFVRTSLSDDGITLERASTDAGMRSYWRARRDEQSWIVMDAPPGQEDVRPWLRLRGVLEAGGVRVPGVLAESVDEGLLLLEDLGGPTLLDVIDADGADAWFDRAIDQLLALQAIECPPDLPAYDEQLLLRELALFEHWFVGVHLGLALDHEDLERLRLVGSALVDAARAQPQVLVHRDFMPRNLMPLGDATLAVLDFQDAVRGPIAYDVLSLFKDAFISWPEPDVGRWIERYRTRAEAAGLKVPDARRFRRDVDLIGVQRHLKVLGIFARLQHRDGKPRYLADAPRFIAYLDTVLPRHPELLPLAEFFGRTLRPALTVGRTT